MPTTKKPAKTTKAVKVPDDEGRFEVRWTGTAPFSGNVFEVNAPFTSYRAAKKHAQDVARRPKVGVAIAVQYRNIRIVEFEPQNAEHTASVIARFD